MKKLSFQDLQDKRLIPEELSAKTISPEDLGLNHEQWISIQRDVTSLIPTRHQQLCAAQIKLFAKFVNASRRTENPAVVDTVFVNYCRAALRLSRATEWDQIAVQMQDRQPPSGARPHTKAFVFQMLYDLLFPEKETL